MSHFIASWTWRCTLNCRHRIVSSRVRSCLIFHKKCCNSESKMQRCLIDSSHISFHHVYSQRWLIYLQYPSKVLGALAKSIIASRYPDLRQKQMHIDIVFDENVSFEGLPLLPVSSCSPVPPLLASCPNVWAQCVQTWSTCIQWREWSAKHAGLSKCSWTSYSVHSKWSASTFIARLSLQPSGRLGRSGSNLKSLTVNSPLKESVKRCSPSCNSLWLASLSPCKGVHGTPLLRLSAMKNESSATPAKVLEFHSYPGKEHQLRMIADSWQACIWEKAHWTYLNNGKWEW